MNYIFDLKRSKFIIIYKNKKFMYMNYFWLFIILERISLLGFV